jgi:tryptophan-rich sensory protein
MKNQLWWNSSQGWRNKYINRDPKNGRVKWYFGLDKPVQLTDAWHHFKMWMIIFICVSITLVVMNPPIMLTLTDNWLDYVINFIGQLWIMGGVWNKTFTIFYHTLLIKK